MTDKKNEERVIRNYEENEKMMILVYAQWCVNNGIDPVALYKKAYPVQTVPALLDEVIDATVSKDESEEITGATVLKALEMFGNDDLAFAVKEEMDKKGR